MSKRFLFIFLMALIPLFFSCRTSRKLVVSNSNLNSGSLGMVTDDYVRTYQGIAVSEMKRTGIPASITLAQGMVESDFGRSSLARNANNHFGIKCHDDWKGPTVIQNDDSSNECFRKYDNPEKSFYDHSEFLKTKSRYNFLFDIDPSDYKAWAYGLKKAGYATNPEYANMLIKKIEENNLMYLDVPQKQGRITTSTPSGVPPASSSLAIADTATTIVNKSAGQAPNNDNLTKGETPVNWKIAVYERVPRVKENNKIQYIIVRDGDTRQSIEREFQLLKWELPRYNELKSDFEPVPGQILYIQPKREKAEPGKEFHITANGDTMYKISQQYAIKLKSLYSMNKMAAGTEAVAGTKLWLRGTKTAN